MSYNIREEYKQKWKEAYDSLNIQQKLAVDTIEGPVMTIAGPGTGKTQLLAVRIGNILLKTDALPQNILCLTYTDAGTVAMRRRLESFIGPEAYNVSIQTFHSFCNSVIRDNMSYFSELRELQQVSDIEEVEIYRQLIDSFDSDHPLKRHKTDVYFEVSRLKNLFSMMKQENLRPDDFRKAYQDFEKNSLDPATSDFVYKTSKKDGDGGFLYKKGDIKIKEVNALLERYNKPVAASESFDSYMELMKKSARIDYNDMILFVINSFKTHDHLLGKYQEQFQYILVDEYQDTNGVQNELLFLLADFWEKPNLFIVGDDDQSIFRFQGANMGAIIEFKEKYAPAEIVLTQNYRSSQIILDYAKNLIENNVERLVAQYPYLVKDLFEARKEKKTQLAAPQIIEYLNATQEEVGIVQKIEELHRHGVPYKNIGVIYTKHALVENITKYLALKKIPLNIKKRINVLDEPDVIKVCTILEYILMESQEPHSGNYLLFEILHYDMFGLSPLDLASVSIACKPHLMEGVESKLTYKNWRNILQSKQDLTSAGVDHIEDVMNVSKIIEDWIKQSFNVTIQMLIEKIITDSGLLDQILSSEDKAFRLQAFNTYFDFIKNEAAKKGMLTLREAVQLIQLMRDEKLKLEVNRIFSNENGVNFMTAHGSKGLEFEHVFIMRSNENTWEKNRGNNQNYSLPPGITAASDDGTEEDVRRLFFVAVTRAMDYVYISYISKDDKEKDIQMSKFVSEIREVNNEILKPNISEALIVDYKTELMRYRSGQATFIDHELIDRILETFKLSTTSLNKYLKCPLSFYFENILGVPRGRNASMGFGSAIHYALEHFFVDIEKSKPRSMASAQKLIEFFYKAMDKYKSHFTQEEWIRYREYGEITLKAYYQNYSTEWLQTPQFRTELDIRQVQYDGVPLTGKLDRVNIYKDNVTVTDYKTGKFSNSKSKLNPPSDKEPLGGDYWRQIVFYRILLDGFKGASYNMTHGIMDFVEMENDKFEAAKVQCHPNDIEEVGLQIKQTYQNIKEHKFEEGCNEDNCTWCNFVKNNMPAAVTDEDEI